MNTKSSPSVKKLFGKTIQIESKLIRNNHKWQEEKLQKPVLVIVLGKRTLANGHVNYNYEEGNEFVPTEHVNALLVVERMDRNPFYISLSKLNPGLSGSL